MLFAPCQRMLALATVFIALRAVASACVALLRHADAAAAIPAQYSVRYAAQRRAACREKQNCYVRIRLRHMIAAARRCVVTKCARTFCRLIHVLARGDAEFAALRVWR